MSEEEEDNQYRPSAVSDSLRNRLFEQRSIVLSGDITQARAAEIVMQLLALSQASEDPINMYVNSQGGHVESGDTIHDMVRFVRPRVRMIGTGWVASAGALIYVAVPLKDRYCLKNTRFLLHQPSGGVRGPHSAMDIEVKQILKMRDRLNRIFAKETGQTVERIEEDTKRNFWLDAGAAKEYGLVGQIIDSIDELK